MENATPAIDWLPLVVGLAGGLGLFLFGLEQMTTALKAVAGDRLRLLLARLTVNRFAGVATGAFITTVIQSSSVTTVLVVSFISSGLMTLSQSIGVILGANIGTTVTAQIVAFKVTKLALGMVAVGFAITFVTDRETLRHHGNGILGLGLVFLGMTLMGEAMAPLRGHEPFQAWMLRMEHPALGIAAGAVFTALVQSSSATTGIVIAMAAQSLLPLQAGIALILGANVGTCITALLAAVGKPRAAIQAAAVHVMFNTIGVLVWLPFVDELARFAAWLSPRVAEVSGLERLAAVTPRQIANAHTVFNIANTLLFLPFVGVLAAVVERLVPESSRARGGLGEPQFLDADVIETPTLALQQARLEIARLGQIVIRMHDDVLLAMLSGTLDDLQAVVRMDEAADELHGAIIGFLGRISRGTLTGEQTEELMHLMAAANALEAAGDVIETDLVARGRQRLEDGVRVSEHTRKVIAEFHREVAECLRHAVVAVAKGDADVAKAVVDAKSRVNSLADHAARHHAARLVSDEADRISLYSLEVDMIEHLRRVFYFAKRIAHGVIAFETEVD
ncbi:MAG: Na/Pi cotransporter family protein [Myxococcota bacterium]|nr:Na/Pi cotransporter family protein [Myxococcota bacterium]